MLWCASMMLSRASMIELGMLYRSAMGWLMPPLYVTLDRRRMLAMVPAVMLRLRMDDMGGLGGAAAPAPGAAPEVLVEPL